MEEKQKAGGEEQKVGQRNDLRRVERRKGWDGGKTKCGQRGTRGGTKEK